MNGRSRALDPGGDWRSGDYAGPEFGFWDVCRWQSLVFLPSDGIEKLAAFLGFVPTNALAVNYG